MRHILGSALCTNMTLYSNIFVVSIVFPLKGGVHQPSFFFKKNLCIDINLEYTLRYHDVVIAFSSASECFKKQYFSYLKDRAALIRASAMGFLRNKNFAL